MEDFLDELNELIVKHQIGEELSEALLGVLEDAYSVPNKVNVLIAGTMLDEGTPVFIGSDGKVRPARREEDCVHGRIAEAL